LVLSHAVIGDIVGQPLPQLLSTISSMVLYLCTDGPDLARATAPVTTKHARKVPIADRDVRVLRAGWRLGAALRAAHAQYEAERAAGPTGRRVAPHLRRPHCLVNSGPCLVDRSDPPRRFRTANRSLLFCTRNLMDQNLLLNSLPPSRGGPGRRPRLLGQAAVPRCGVSLGDGHVSC
jgi:hypothetical protein